VPHNPYYSQDVTRVIKSRRKKWVENVACMGTTRNIYQVLVEKLTAMLISRPWHRWENNIKMDLN